MTKRKDLEAFEAFAATLQLDGRPYGLSLDRLVDDRRYASLETEAAYLTWVYWQSLITKPSSKDLGNSHTGETDGVLSIR